MGGKSWRRVMKGWKRWRLQIKSILYMRLFLCLFKFHSLYLWKPPTNSGSSKGSAVEKQAKAEGPSRTCIFLHIGNDCATSKVWLHVFYSLVCRDVHPTKRNSHNSDVCELWIIYVAWCLIHPVPLAVTGGDASWERVRYSMSIRNWCAAAYCAL